MRFTLRHFIIATSILVSHITSHAACVQVYFDQSPLGETYWMGKTYAGLVQNLLGHFPHLQQIVSPIEFYQAGDLNRCANNIYIGSYFNNPLPAAFLADYVTTPQRVAWLGSNIWQLAPEKVKTLLGAEYQAITALEKTKMDYFGQPTFFKDVLYKGEVFSKYGKFNREKPPVFVAAFEMARMKLDLGPLSPEVLASIKHNGTNEVIPYAIRKNNRFYIADVPLSFMHESDRYMVFADLLFDILNEKPRNKERYAFIRLEDLHPLVPIPYIYSAITALNKENVPYNLSIIPWFFDPLFSFARGTHQEFVTLSDVPEYLQILKEAQATKNTIIWHGVTHQLGNQRNPHTGISGDDFEFWNAKQGRVLDQDSSEFVFDRLDNAHYDLVKNNIHPKLWLTPHYQASPLDYIIFAQVFPWNVGRVIYFNHHIVKKPEPVKDSSQFWYTKSTANPLSQKLRREHFKQYQVSIDSERWTGQIFPFEIYGDIYGQRLLPENLGNSQPVLNDQVTQTRTVQEMLIDARRNLVLRDTWASFFFHVQLLNNFENGGQGRYPGDSGELIQLTREIQRLGYRFISLEEFVNKDLKTLRPEPIYILKPTNRGVHVPKN